MLRVDVRWRPSGGRGEYEHVPSDVLLNRRVVVDPIWIANARIVTDVWGLIRDGKPRLRREDPNNRKILNLPQLVAALALLPDSIREDHGEVVLPLRDKGYVISSISFIVDISTDGVALCIPQRMQILHDVGEIDLSERFLRVGELLTSSSLPSPVQQDVGRYVEIVNSGLASVELRTIADRLLNWVSADAAASRSIDAPSEGFSSAPAAPVVTALALTDLGVDETKRKLTAHYQIDRSRKIRRAKIKEFGATYGAVYCENCSFDFFQKYGDRGLGFIEVHHKVPLAGLLPNTVTYLSDLLLLCSNCHRMVHRRRPDLSPIELKAITR